jgi:hypothetical protein
MLDSVGQPILAADALSSGSSRLKAGWWQDCPPHSERCPASAIRRPQFSALRPDKNLETEMCRIIALVLPVILALPLHAQIETKPEPAPSLPHNVLTNDGVITLAEAGYGEEFLIDLIRMKTGHFDTSADGLAVLARHGVAESVVRAMLARESSHTQTAVAVTPVVHVQVVQRGGLFRRRWQVIEPTPAPADGQIRLPPW